MYKLGFEEAEERIKLSAFIGSWRKQGSSRKTSASLMMLKLLAVWITTNCGKLLKKDGNTTLPASRETCMQVKKKQFELDMKQQTGSKLGKKYNKAIYCHASYLNSMQSTSSEMLGWMNPKLESKLLGEGLTISDMQMMPPL